MLYLWNEGKELQAKCNGQQFFASVTFEEYMGSSWNTEKHKMA